MQRTERESTNNVGLNISGEKIKAVVEKRSRSEMLTINDYDIEAVNSVKYQGTVINNTDDDTEEIKSRILAACKAYFSLQTMF
jgi:hypothetical protein